MPGIHAFVIVVRGNDVLRHEGELDRGKTVHLIIRQVARCIHRSELTLFPILDEEMAESVKVRREHGNCQRSFHPILRSNK